MKKILLIVLLLSVGFSQKLTEVVKTYDNGNIKSITYHKKTRDGIEKVKYEGYYKNGQKSQEGTYKDGKFNCFDGSKSIDASWVNDRECDCSDCSDEPLR